jgi:hypothetical protein
MSMTQSTEPAGRLPALPLEEMFKRYLGRQTVAQGLGLGHAEPAGEVEPYEAVPVQPVEPTLAWADAVAAVSHFDGPRVQWPLPPDWPALVASQEPAVAVPFALGNFPQLVRYLEPLVVGEDAAVTKKPGRSSTPDGLTAWADQHKSYPVSLLAAGVLRLAQEFEAAERLLGRSEDVPRDFRAMHANEAAALAWERGRHADALAIWKTQPPSVPVLFNLGMALLFTNRPAEATEPLTKAVAGLKETSAWYHLGQLYLTLAKARG